MKKIQLSQTGVEVSCLALGTLRFGTRNTYDEAARLMDMYVEAGGNFIDTANAYDRWCSQGKGGESEVTIGRWLRERGLRDRLFIATKVGFGYQDVADGLAAATIISECENSLRKLGTDRIDLFYAHKDDPNIPLEETLSAFNKLIADGKIRFFGASNYLPWRLADADAIAARKGWQSFACVEQRGTYLRPNPGANFSPQQIIDRNLMTYCDARGKTILPYTPLLRGAYIRSDRPIPSPYRGPDTDLRLAVLHEVTRELGANANQVVLAWMMYRQPPFLPVFSARNPKQMQENLGALDITLSAEQIERLDRAGNCVNDEPV
ncbi:MAG: aldo/keto reductase [Prochloraceae cyanobacterium]|nr:aldo/keto reductase [Prochloraceae cyanobacterium]